MTTTVVKSIGTASRDYATLSGWHAGAPTDLTLTASSTAGSGSTTSNIVLNAGASGTDNFYTGHPVTCGGETRLITGYTGSTKTATIGSLNGSAATWSSAPATSAAYSIDSVIWRGECYNDSVFTTSGNLLTISGSTTDSTHYKELTAAAGQSFSDNANVQTNALRYNTANGVSLANTATYSDIVIASEQYVRISRLQLRTGATDHSSCFTLVSGGNFFDVNQCIFEGKSGGSAYLVFTNTTAQIGTIRNSLVVVTAAAAALGAINTNVVNCTIAILSGLGSTTLLASDSSSHFTNCGFFNNGGTLASGGGVYTTCYTDAASPPSGCTATAYATGSGTKFVDISAGTYDFRIQSGSSLIDVGTTDSTNAAFDIAGTSRPQGSAYDVGCWEYVSAGAPFMAAKMKSTLQAIGAVY